MFAGVWDSTSVKKITGTRRLHVMETLCFRVSKWTECIYTDSIWFISQSEAVGLSDHGHFFFSRCQKERQLGLFLSVSFIGQEMWIPEDYLRARTVGLFQIPCQWDPDGNKLEASFGIQNVKPLEDLRIKE